jgi:uncharacterized protein (TIGR02145 family)
MSNSKNQNTMKTKTLIQNLTFISILLIGCFCASSIYAQIAVTTDGTPPDASAMLDVKSTDKGLLLPRMTQTEIEQIIDPANGLIVYNIDNNHFYYFDAEAFRWKEIAIGAGNLHIGCGTITDADGNNYNTVRIYTQCWMAENLVTSKYNDGTDIPFYTDISEFNYLTTQGYCHCTYCTETPGALYNWYAVNTGILCPAGWHVPTDDDWATLINNLGGESVAGGKLKETDPLKWPCTNTATNESGFGALASGTHTGDGGGCIGYYWSANEDGPDMAWYNSFRPAIDVVRGSGGKNYGLSVRCVKD